MKKKIFLLVLVLVLLVMATPVFVSANAIYDCNNDGGLIGPGAVADLANAACVRVEHEPEFGFGK